jgi:histidinol-phosphatase (PHP family)
MKIDLHNHTPLCHHAQGTPKEYVLKAIDEQIDIYGFSDHAPMEFDQQYRMSLSQAKDYEQEILKLKKQFQNDINILLGYEVDYIHNENLIQDYILNAKVDYLIGSVHFINKWGFDNPEFIGEYKHKNIDQIWEDYFEAIYYMAKSGYFQIVGHLDLIKVFNFLPKKDIRLIAKKAIKEIKKQNLVVEINGAGFQKPIKEQYPSKKLLELIYEEGIDITFGSDAHQIKQVGANLNQMITLAKNIGFSTQVYFINKEKVTINL